MPSPLKTVIIGFGQIADTLADDPKMRRHFGHASHAQVLSEHPDFAWEAVVDPSPEARERARERWGVPHACATVDELGERYDPEIAVITSPPVTRKAAIESLPSLRGVFVEKPLGMESSEAEKLVATCADRDLPVQVNFWRRAVPEYRSWEEGPFPELVGLPQTVFGVYGNGLYNNGGHLVDLLRRLFGEPTAVQTLSEATVLADAPLSGDVEVDFSLVMEGSIRVTVHALDFRHYREIGLDVWGTEGRVMIEQEGLALVHCPRRDNRGLSDAREVASDEPRVREVAVDRALWAMHGNLAEVVRGEAELLCPIAEAVRTEKVLHAVLQSATDNGGRIALDRVPGASDG